MKQDDNDTLNQLHFSLQLTQETFADIIAELMGLPSEYHDEAFSMCWKCLAKLVIDFMQIEDELREVI